jgi:hypothetical protein
MLYGTRRRSRPALLPPRLWRYLGIPDALRSPRWAWIASRRVPRGGDSDLRDARPDDGRAGGGRQLRDRWLGSLSGPADHVHEGSAQSPRAWRNCASSDWSGMRCGDVGATRRGWPDGPLYWVSLTLLARSEPVSPVWPTLHAPSGFAWTSGPRRTLPLRRGHPGPPAAGSSNKKHYGTTANCVAS